MVATQIFFMFTPKIGEDEPILTHIFQMGWFNHQLVDVGGVFLGENSRGWVSGLVWYTLKKLRFSGTLKVWSVWFR